jgi:NAD(P)-dependent dehydrogenase (short-subunit alcohol dehydrogenase family)
VTLFVTGGASGIGLHLARLVAERGARVAVFDLHVPDAVRTELTDRVGGADRLALFDGVDVRDPQGLAAAVTDAVARVGPPTLAINSAGISRNDRFVESTLEDFEQTIAVNLVGSRNYAAAVLPHLARGSRLALIASLAGITGGYTYAAYASSKAGVIGLARVLRLECAPEGIVVSVICPPEIMTPMVERYATTMHPATRALKDVAGTLPIDDACREMLAQLDRGRFLVIPGRRARRAARMSRWLPDRVTMAMTDRIVRRALDTMPPSESTG